MNVELFLSPFVVSHICRYEPGALIAAFQEGREASLQRLQAWTQWRQDGGTVSYDHGAFLDKDEPLCAESELQSRCSAPNSVVFVPSVPASVSRAGLQAAFGSLAGLNEVIPGPVRADLVHHVPFLRFVVE
jgi:hypothetical protein